MNTKTIVCGIAIASLGFSSLSFAQPAVREARQDAREARQDMREAQRDLRNARNPRQAQEARQDLRRSQRDLREARQDRREARQYYNARGPEFRRGGHLPPELRNRTYVVNDWRGHRLAAPPRGYQWVQVGPDYVLAAIATGVIANLILNQ
ncbi:MAG: RcnB family protein [Pseudomonadota bacterium]